MQHDTAEQLRKAYKITVIVGIGMMGAVMAYAVVVEVLKAQHETFNGFNPLPDAIDVIRYVLLGVAVVEFFAIQILNKVMLSAGDPTGVTIASSHPFAADVQRLMTAAIVSFALCESMAVFGLVLFLIQGRPFDFYTFLLISLFSFAVYFPRYGKWEDWIDERERAARR